MWKLVAFLWDEAILTLQKWVLGESVSTILQPIVALVTKQFLWPHIKFTSPAYLINHRLKASSLFMIGPTIMFVHISSFLQAWSVDNLLQLANLFR